MHRAELINSAAVAARASHTRPEFAPAAAMSSAVPASSVSPHVSKLRSNDRRRRVAFILVEFRASSARRDSIIKATGGPLAERSWQEV